MSKGKMNTREILNAVEATEEALRNGGEPLELPDDAEVTMGDRISVPSLADPALDPFEKFKTDKKRYHYHAINTRPHMIRSREAMGYKTIPGSEFGDLVLGKLPREIKEARDKQNWDKAGRAVRSAKEQFREEAARSGVKTFEE